MQQPPHPPLRDLSLQKGKPGMSGSPEGSSCASTEGQGRPGAPKRGSGAPERGRLCSGAKIAALEAEAGAGQQQGWPATGPQQAGRGHAGRQSRDTQEAGRQQEEAGAQQAGLHTGRQSRDTQEEGLQQGLGWQQEGAEQGESS